MIATQQIERLLPFGESEMREIASGINIENYRELVLDGTYLSELGKAILYSFDVWQEIEERHADVSQHQAATRLVDEVTVQYSRVRLARPATESSVAKLSPDSSQFDDVFKRTTNADLELIAVYYRWAKYLLNRFHEFWNPLHPSPSNID